ncbi:hypothetical protein, partial [Streptomyces capparidis]
MTPPLPWRRKNRTSPAQPRQAPAPGGGELPDGGPGADTDTAVPPASSGDAGTVITGDHTHMPVTDQRGQVHNTVT